MVKAGEGNTRETWMQSAHPPILQTLSHFLFLRPHSLIYTSLFLDLTHSFAHSSLCPSFVASDCPQCHWSWNLQAKPALLVKNPGKTAHLTSMHSGKGTHWQKQDITIMFVMFVLFTIERNLAMSIFLFLCMHELNV